ncbi:MAG: hypothetical protein WAO08_37035 [Hyphomicrobiaceae bacterium]
MSAEVDNLISSAEVRIAHQRKHIRAVASDFEASMKALAESFLQMSELASLILPSTPRLWLTARTRLRRRSG